VVPAFRMILAITIINNFGKCRFIKLYREHMVRSAERSRPTRELGAEPRNCAHVRVTTPPAAATGRAAAADRGEGALQHAQHTTRWCVQLH
jgi:hypothetical protein